MKWEIEFLRNGYFCTFNCMAKDAFEAYEKFHKAFPGGGDNFRIHGFKFTDSNYKKSEISCIE